MFYNLRTEFREEIRLVLGDWRFDGLYVMFSDTNFYITDKKDIDVTIESYNKDFDASIYKTIVLFLYSVLSVGFEKASCRLKRNEVNSLDVVIKVNID